MTAQDVGDAHATLRAGVGGEHSAETAAGDERVGAVPPEPAATAGTAATAGSARSRWSAGLLDSLRVALPGWVLGHLLVIAVSAHLNPRHPLAALFDWDTIWYRKIAAQGYGPVGGLVHFFPLTPAAGGLIALVTRIPVTLALFGFCWVAALAYGAMLHRLVLLETGDRGAARRAAWLIQLAPGGYALVMGYTEPFAGLLAVSYFFVLRLVAIRGRAAEGAPRRHWPLWAAIVFGFFSGMARPTGIVLAFPGAVEGWRIARADGWRLATTVKAAAAAVAPAAGLFAFLAYSKVAYGSWKMPLTQQTLKSNRGGLAYDPLKSLRFWIHGGGRANHGLQTGTMAALLIGLGVLLIVVVARRLPFSYTAWVLPAFALAITSQNFTSLPRYFGALFPVLMVVAMLAKRRWQEYAVYAISAGLLLWTTHIVLSLWLIA